MEVNHSKSMGVNTKPAHRLMVGKYWLLVDPNMPEDQFATIKRLCQEDTFGKSDFRDVNSRLKKQKKEKVFVRSVSEICIDADNHSDDLEYLSNLWKEIVLNKYKYSLVEIIFMKEHLVKYGENMGEKDAELLKTLLQTVSNL